MTMLSEDCKRSIMHGLDTSAINLMLLSGKFDEQLTFMWEYAKRIGIPTYVAVVEGVEIPDDIKKSKLFHGSCTFRKGDEQSMKDCVNKLILLARKNEHVRGSGEDLVYIR